MKSIFQKLNFPKPPGGNCYEWKEAETSFATSKTGLYAIKITASAKSAKQNNSKDDDDLRISLDGFSFGKYEKHDEEVSWKGFGTSASFDGDSQKGGTKIIYFFVELEKGNHEIQFFTDETPKVISLEVFLIENNKFALENLKPPEKIESNKRGIPWLSFIFLGTQSKNILLDVKTRSAKEKASTDGDNVKIVINGKILKNKQAPSSEKYKNFYFSGDIKSAGILSINNEDLSSQLSFENSIELWYDQEPEINSIQIDFFDPEKFLKEFDSFADLRNFVLRSVKIATIYFDFNGNVYSSKFLKNSLKEKPDALIFKANHPIAGKIKADPVYKKILEKLKEKLKTNILEGELWPEDFEGKINLDTEDLKTAIHGIKKIEYQAKSENGKFAVEMTLLDIYDFEKVDVPSFLYHDYSYFKGEMNNIVDLGEEFNIVHDFEVQIHIIDII